MDLTKNCARALKAIYRRAWRQSALGWMVAATLLVTALGLGSLLLSRIEIERVLRIDPSGLRQHRELVVNGRRPHLLILGDSRAAGIGHNDLAGYTLINHGIAGQTIDQVVSRAGRDLILLRPDRVLVLMGINDLKVGNALPGDFEIMIGGVDELLAMASSMGIPATVCEVWPNAKSTSARSLLLPADLLERVSEFNSRLSKAATNRGAGMMGVKGLLEREGYVRRQFALDSLHLNEKGKQVLRRALSSQIDGPAPVAK